MYIYQKNLENIIFHGEILKDFFPENKNGRRLSIYLFLFNCPSQCNMTRKKLEGGLLSMMDQGALQIIPQKNNITLDKTVRNFD